MRLDFTVLDPKRYRQTIAGDEKSAHTKTLASIEEFVAACALLLVAS
jgi:hypothetical protein